MEGSSVWFIILLAGYLLQLFSWVKNYHITSEIIGGAIYAILMRKRIKNDQEQYKHHWFPDRPCKGSGYRCIRINHKMDPLVGQAGQRIGLSIQQLYCLLPSELTLWVDPFEVSYRIGEDGSICVLYESQPAAQGGSGVSAAAVAVAAAAASALPPLVDSRISCKEELLLGRTSPSKAYSMMTVSS